MAKSVNYDARCYELAETFLEASPHLNTDKRRDMLAQIIQSAIEDFLTSEQDNYEPPDPPGFEGGFANNH